jgi:hypothetical protein
LRSRLNLKKATNIWVISQALEFLWPSVLG